MASSVPAELLKQLSAASDSLNTITSQFNEHITSIENALASYNIGVAAWAHACTIDHEQCDDAGNIVDIHSEDINIGYDKSGGKWSLQVSSFYRDSESLREWPLKDAPRDIRLRAI